MKKVTKTAGMVSVAFLLVGCQNTEDETQTTNVEPVEESASDESDQDENQGVESEAEDHDEENSSEHTNDENDDNEDTEEVSSNDDEEDDTNVYGGTLASGNYFIDTGYFDDGTNFITTFFIKRNGEGDYSNEDRLERSLIDNDPSEQDILSSFADISLDWPDLYIQFNVNIHSEENELATTSAQSNLFFNSLFGISDLYGVEEIVFLNQDGEKDIEVAERLIDDSIIVKDERGLSRGYYTIYDEELEQTLFLSGAELEEEVANDNGDPLTFSETVEAMGTIDHEDAFYSSAVVEGIEIVNASIENSVATVEYTMDEEINTEADRTVFENAIQLAALDFHAWEVRLINDTMQEVVTYPLVGQ
ncbi:hypothetical protein [Alkalicoccobacillus plakortidis]|uniref:YusW-like protein n=1 Tax=Alkalicoccobacillus plakortidis TaxID=444060 RepID=A0ABT0XRM6_9BACI|nr:hypothetical protein [Alkalicoccobacillus plakortidis]MCM2677924.1 hypothetical protein [Alkalicoccobacillus plakortidis]